VKLNFLIISFVEITANIDGLIELTRNMGEYFNLAQCSMNTQHSVQRGALYCSEILVFYISISL
jgi:hypothetical protein